MRAIVERVIGRWARRASLLRITTLIASTIPTERATHTFMALGYALCIGAVDLNQESGLTSMSDKPFVDTPEYEAQVDSPFAECIAQGHESVSCPLGGDCAGNQCCDSEQGTYPCPSADYTFNDCALQTDVYCFFGL